MRDGGSGTCPRVRAQHGMRGACQQSPHIRAGDCRRTPHGACSVAARAGWDPSVLRLGRPRRATIANPLGAARAGRDQPTGPRSLRGQDGALWRVAGLEIAPEGDEEFPSEGGDEEPSEASGGGADAAVEPLRQSAPGLPAKPAPCGLDEDPSGASVAGLADALLDALVAAVARAGVEAGVAGDLAAVGEVSPEHLVAEHAGDLAADASEALEVDDPGFGGAELGLALRTSCLVEEGELAVDEIEALALAADLVGEMRQQGAPVAGDEAGDLPLAIAGPRLGVVDADRHQQPGDPVAMCRALGDEPAALAGQAALVLEGRLGHTHHRAAPALAAIPGDQGVEDGLDVEAVALAPARARLALQRARIDDQALDPGGGEDPVQPEALVTCLVAAAHPHRSAKPLRGIPARPLEQFDQLGAVTRWHAPPRRPRPRRRQHRHQPLRPAQLDRCVHDLRKIPFHDAPPKAGSATLG